MNKRLVWNFEIGNQHSFDWQDLPTCKKEDLRWEARFFWPADGPILIAGLDDSFLSLSNYQIKQRTDRYLLLPEVEYNIKVRRDELLYKPLLQKTEQLHAYGAKINLLAYPKDQPLPGTSSCRAIDLLEQLQRQSQSIKVSKEALIYKLNTEPKIKVELARLQLEQTIYFSLCIEGHSRLLVATLSEHLLKDAVSCDYVHFLRQHVMNDG